MPFRKAASGFGACSRLRYASWQNSRLHRAGESFAVLFAPNKKHSLFS
jgi:hypothetical protein